jgi:hypothetical protein
MRAIAAVFLFVLGLTATGAAWAQNPAPDPALFKTVAGKWGWKDSDTSGCGSNFHTISFPNDKTMTLTFSKPFKSVTGAMTNVSTYDVLYAEGNKITTLIQGETRRTDAGDRVLWVLILKDPNTYAWRRTDWRAEGMTKEIERCR